LENLKISEPLLSRAKLKQWFQEGKILYLQREAKPSFILQPGTHEIILLNCDLAPPQASPSQNGSFLPIIYEDENILILHKTSGIPSAPQSSIETETAVGSALASHPNLFGIGPHPLEPGLLHRLDTDTSGLLAFAKTEEEFLRLTTCWKKREVKKIYRAWVSADPTSFSRLPLTIRFPLAHDAKSSKRMIALKEEKNSNFRGKPLPAITHLLGAQKFQTSSGTLLYDVEIEIETGVMHQIRCHLAAIGIPILGDSVYKGAPSSRLWLHAWKLKIPLKDGKALTLEAQLPPGWNQQ
jgi:23S rRNA pseudouridine1911/1915/1917 synthase